MVPSWQQELIACHISSGRELGGLMDLPTSLGRIVGLPTSLTPPEMRGTSMATCKLLGRLLAGMASPAPPWATGLDDPSFLEATPLPRACVADGRNSGAASGTFLTSRRIYGYNERDRTHYLYDEMPLFLSLESTSLGN